MLNTFIVQPIFNMLVFLYAILPGHNFGAALIIFTILVRLAMWPLVKKQLHNAKAMRALMPEMKKIKAAAKGDKRKEQTMMMELYKERGVSPFSSIGVLLLQLPIIIGLYAAVNRIIKDPNEIVNFSYSWVANTSWMQEVAKDIHKFDETLFGFVDLTRHAVSDAGIYWPAMLLVVSSALVQFFQTKQLMPQDKDARSLKSILKEAGQGKTAEQQEVNAAVGRFTLYIIPIFVFIFGLNFPAALPLYWLVSSSVAYLQQWWILREDEEEMEAIVDKKKGSTTTKSGLKVTRRTVGQDEVAAKAVKAKKKPKTKTAAKGRRRK